MVDLKGAEQWSANNSLNQPKTVNIPTVSACLIPEIYFVVNFLLGYYCYIFLIASKISANLLV